MPHANEDILITLENGIQKIILNRPKKRNAITSQMYVKLANAIKNSNENEEIQVVVITGNGEFFSSGNDMISLMENEENKNVPRTLEKIKELVKALILCQKLLIAVVNGPAIGIAATTLALYDIVYASKNAYFQTPFSKIGFTVEGCSSYTFPRILGKSKAGEMLYLGYKLNVQEAKERGLVSKIFGSEEIEQIWEEIENVTKLSQESIKGSKNLCSRWDQQTLLRVNEEEIKTLIECVGSEKFAETMLQYISKMSKM